MSYKDQTISAGVPSVDKHGLGEHVPVKSIVIIFLDKRMKPSEKLEVFVDDEQKSAGWMKIDSPEGTLKWNSKDGFALFPNDSITIRPLHSRWSRSHVKFGRDRDQIDSYTILAKDIISFCNRQPADSPPDGIDYPGPPSGKNSKISLKVSLRGFDEALVKVDTASLNPNAEKEILESLSSSESLQECASKLRSVFSEIADNVEVGKRWYKCWRMSLPLTQ